MMKTITSKTLNEWLKLCLKPYLGVLLLLTILGSWQAFLTHSTWHVGDWLINYQGGFVRRGLLGEFLYQLSCLTNISPGFYTFLVQTLFNSLFFIFCFLSLQRQKSLLAFSLLIFSPFLFTYQVNSFDHIESQGGYFKESIYCCIVALAGWAAINYSAKQFLKIFYLILALYPLAILTHESFAIFLPFLLIIYFIKVEPDHRGLLILVSLLSLSLFSFVACLIFSGSKTQVFAIYNSLLPKYPVSTYGSIGWLMMPMKAAIERVLIQIHYNDYFKNYSLVLFLSLIAFLPLSKQLKFVFKNKLCVILFLFSLVGTVCLCTVAIDWGRFIRINLVSLFILALVAETLRTKSENPYQEKSLHMIMLSLLFILSYALLWRIPSCCNYRPPVSGLATNNLTWSFGPYKKIAQDIIHTINRV